MDPPPINSPLHSHRFRCGFPISWPVPSRDPLRTGSIQQTPLRPRPLSSLAPSGRPPSILRYWALAISAAMPQGLAATQSNLAALGVLLRPGALSYVHTVFSLPRARWTPLGLPGSPRPTRSIPGFEAQSYPRELNPATPLKPRRA